jgi:uncharacterized membrane protein
VDATRRFQVSNLAFAGVAAGHAFLTWPVRATVALFLGGVIVAFVAEVLVVRAGLLEHAIEPQFLGVPLSVLLVWPAVVYVALRVALVFTDPGLGAAGLAAVIATAFDVLTDPQGVAEGVWTYPDHRLSAPRFYDVPWWNFAGWFVIVFASAMIPISVGL